MVGPDDLDAELALALELADLADAITLPHFRAADLLVEHKADRTEVTEADRGTEAAIRARLAEARPDHAVLGEEEGLIGPADARARWIIDPIDGTSNYVKGIPIWATLIALELDGELVGGRRLGAGARSPLVGGPGQGRLRGRPSHHGVLRDDAGRRPPGLQRRRLVLRPRLG